MSPWKAGDSGLKNDGHFWWCISPSILRKKHDEITSVIFNHLSPGFDFKVGPGFPRWFSRRDLKWSPIVGLVTIRPVRVTFSLTIRKRSPAELPGPFFFIVFSVGFVSSVAAFVFFFGLCFGPTALFLGRFTKPKFDVRLVEAKKW